jgi:hypothetical protein
MVRGEAIDGIVSKVRCGGSDKSGADRGGCGAAQAAADFGKLPQPAADGRQRGFFRCEIGEMIAVRGDSECAVPDCRNVGRSVRPEVDDRRKRHPQPPRTVGINGCFTTGARIRAGIISRNAPKHSRAPQRAATLVRVSPPLPFGL